MRTVQRLVVLALAVLFVMGSWGCGGTGAKPAGGKGTLSFQDDAVSWVTAGNFFATINHPTTPNWLGVLFQIGKFGDNPFEGKVEFKGAGGNHLTTPPLTEGRLDASQFTWINIVSKRPGVNAPLEPNQVLVLFPNAHANACDASNAGGNCLADCLRDRRIHWEQKPISFIITYWQGDKGFKVDSKPYFKDSDHADWNTVDFMFQDDFEVVVYKLNASNEMEEVVRWGEGEVKTITVENIFSGTPHGGKHDPPWIQ